MKGKRLEEMSPLELLGKVVRVIYEMRREYYALLLEISVIEWDSLTMSQQSGFVHEVFRYLKFDDTPEVYYDKFFEKANQAGIIMIYPNVEGQNKPLTGYEDLPWPLKQSAHVTYFIAKTIEQFIDLNDLPDDVELNYDSETLKTDYNEDDPDRYILDDEETDPPSDTKE